MPRGGLARLAGAAAGGALCALALPPLGLWGLAWFALAPMMIAANAGGSGRAALSGWLAGAAFHAVGFFWIYQTCRFAQVPVPVALLAWLSLAGFLALNWALAALAASAAPARLRPFAWAVFWTALAAASERWTPRLGGDLLAYTQWPNLSLIQAGSWGGPHLLGFVIVLANAALAEAWEEAEPARRPLTLGLAAAAGLWLHGTLVLLSRPERREPAVRVEMLQPAIDQYQKWSAAHAQEILAGIDELLARPRAVKPALVVWPETSIPRWQKRGVPAEEAARWAKSQGAVHLVGVLAEAEGGAGHANGLQAVAADGALAGFYAKRELVPFGEYVPGRSLIPRLVVERWLGILDQFGDADAGAAEQALLPTPLGRAAGTICYEAVFPRWAWRDARRGAALIVNVTNDGWYKDTWGPHQHFITNIFRAIETRRTVLRSGNTGISAAIDPWGVVLAKLDLNVRGRLDVDVPAGDPFPEGSFYVRRGDWLGVSCLLLAALLLAVRLLRPR